MILYRLQCANEHEFDVWFRDSAGYDEQHEAGVIACPVCGDNTVEKAIMAPRVAGRKAGQARVRDAAPRPGRGRRPEAGDQPAPLSGTDPQAMGNGEVLQMLKSFREHVEKNCDYVGDRFSEEARKIHYGEAEERGIYGEATAEEASSLIDEGIPVGRIPRLRHDA